MGKPRQMNTSYGYNRNDHNWVSAKDVVCRLVDIVSKGGNYLLNVGPTEEGLIPQPCVDCLAEVGKWMDINGEAIYGTSPWRVLRDGPPESPPLPAESASPRKAMRSMPSAWAGRTRTCWSSRWANKDFPARPSPR